MSCKNPKVTPEPQPKKKMWRTRVKPGIYHWTKCGGRGDVRGGMGSIGGGKGPNIEKEEMNEKEVGREI